MKCPTRPQLTMNKGKKYLGVDHEVFCMDEEFDPEAFKAMMKTIRVDGFHPRYFYK